MRAFNLSWAQYEEGGPGIDRVDVRLLMLLGDLNKYTDDNLIVHCLYDDERDPENLHRQGLACDGHIENMHLIDQYVCISRFPFKGIGLYTAWNHPGFHIDLRNQRIGARWACKTLGTYVALNADFMRHALTYDA
jgi:hypothetical protein